MAETQPVEEKMSSKDMLNDLQQQLTGIDKRHEALNTRRGMAANQVESIKADFIGKLFDILRENGVNPADMGSVRDFLQKLEQTDPDLAELFEYGFTSLTEDPGLMPQNEEMPLNPEELRGRYSNLRQGLNNSASDYETEVII
jgi:hypothetical protein